jgi:DNA-binding transcriptional LysR family regulator
MIDIDDMRCFVAVVDSGGFSRAAARLGISKSMVSRRIAGIEDDLQTRLLSRTTRGVNPTEAALEFKARSERIIAEFDEARAMVALHSGEVIGRLRISLPLSFGVRHVSPTLTELAKRHPRLEIDASFNDRRVDLIAERFDAAIRIGALRDSSLIARRLAPVRSVLVASPDYLARRGRPQTPQDLLAHDFVMNDGSTTSDIRIRAGCTTVGMVCIPDATASAGPRPP